MLLNKEDSIIGCLLGTAIGDSIGLPYEGLSKQRQYRMYPDISGHHFFVGKGMISDDTEHTCIVAQAIIRHYHK
jgi:ADP-ribosylglycohydrolase